MTPAFARNLHDRLKASHDLVMWFVSRLESGKYVARAWVGDHSGGRQEGGELTADTLDALRAMLPPELMRQERSTLDPAGTIEAWG